MSSFLSTTTTHLRHQETRGVGGPEHVDEEVISQHIQLLDLLSLAHSVIVNITMLVSTMERLYMEAQDGLKTISPPLFLNIFFYFLLV